MTIKVFSSFCWLAMLAAVPALSQISYEAPDSREAKTTSSSVAHVYVATPKGIELYNAASNGKLTLVSGSPFAGNLFDLVTNGKYLYGTDGTLIYEDSVGPNGALKQEATFNPGKYTGISGGGVIELTLTIRAPRCTATITTRMTAQFTSPTASLSQTATLLTLERRGIIVSERDR